MVTRTYNVSFKMEINEKSNARNLIDELLANFEPCPELVRAYEVKVEDLGRGRIIGVITQKQIVKEEVEK